MAHGGSIRSRMPSFLIEMTDNNSRKSITSALNNAERLNPELNSFLSIEREHAEQRLAKIQVGDSEMPLRGLGIAVKDNICTAGLQTTCGSRILHNYKAQYDATAIKRLNDAGAVVIG